MIRQRSNLNSVKNGMPINRNKNTNSILYRPNLTVIFIEKRFILLIIISIVSFLSASAAKPENHTGNYENKLTASIKGDVNINYESKMVITESSSSFITIGSRGNGSCVIIFDKGLDVGDHDLFSASYVTDSGESYEDVSDATVTITKNNDHVTEGTFKFNAETKDGSEKVNVTDGAFTYVKSVD